MAFETGRRSTTVRQLQLLVDFAATNKDLALGRLRSKEGRTLSARLWRECADSLNCEGPARLPKEWTKVWNDMKCRVRSKLVGLTPSQRGTGGGPPSNIALNDLEERVADIIGRDVGPIANVAQDPFRQAVPDREEHVPVVIVDDEQHDIVLESHGSIINLSSQPDQAETTSRITPQPTSPPLLTSECSTPRQRRQRPRQRPTPISRSNNSQTRRGALDESRAMVLRIERTRVQAEKLQAEAAKYQAEGAKYQAQAAAASAEADKLRAQTMATFCQSLSTLVPAVKLFLESNTGRRSRRLPSPSSLSDY